MAIPSIPELLPEFLSQLRQGDSQKMSDLIEQIADHFSLSSEDRQAVKKTGERVISNRVWWLNTNCYYAGLLERPSPGWVRLTEKGRSVLRDKVPVTMAWLRHQPEYKEWKQSVQNRSKKAAEILQENNAEEKTPIEALESNYWEARAVLAGELLDRLRTSPPGAFERLVVKLLVAMGYGGGVEDEAARVVGRTGDGGIDGVINQDPLGLDVVCVQAKRWDGTVGEPVVRDFVGSLVGKRSNKGVLLTTSTFSDSAIRYTEGLPQAQKVKLIDGNRLADLMIQFGIGVAEVTRYTVHRVDVDFFEGL